MSEKLPNVPKKLLFYFVKIKNKFVFLLCRYCLYLFYANKEL